jgi:hypothetical protein
MLRDCDYYLRPKLQHANNVFINYLERLALGQPFFFSSDVKITLMSVLRWMRLAISLTSSSFCSMSLISLEIALSSTISILSPPIYSATVRGLCYNLHKEMVIRMDYWEEFNKKTFEYFAKKNKRERNKKLFDYLLEKLLIPIIVAIISSIIVFYLLK